MTKNQKKVLTFYLKFGRILFVRRSGGMADAQASGACSRKAVWVQVPSPAQIKDVINIAEMPCLSHFLMFGYKKSECKNAYSFYADSGLGRSIHLPSCLFLQIISNKREKQEK